MISEVNDKIEVLASFSRGGFRPCLFIWSRRRYPVRRVTATWAESEGFFRQHYFAVLTDGANLYELCFQTRDLVWRLVRVHTD